MRYLMRNAVEFLLEMGLVLTIALVHLALRDALRRQRVREAAAADPGSTSNRKGWLGRHFLSR